MTMIQNRCYGFEVIVNEAGNNATFNVYNMTNVLQPGTKFYTQSTSDKIPTANTRVFGWGITAWQSTTSAAADLVWVDRIHVKYRV